MLGERFLSFQILADSSSQGRMDAQDKAGKVAFAQRSVKRHNGISQRQLRLVRVR